MAKKEDVRVSASRDRVMRRYRHALSRVMRKHFEFFAALHPNETKKRKADLTGPEIAAVSSSAKQLSVDLGEVTDLLREMESLDPDGMPHEKRAIYKSLLFADLKLRGGPKKTGWIERLGRDHVARWAAGLVPDEEVVDLMLQSRFTRHPLGRADVQRILRERWEDGWRPRAVDWISRWAHHIKLTLFRMLARSFEFTREINIRFIRLSARQADAFKLDLPSKEAGRIVRQDVRRKALELAEEEKCLVQILDAEENIVGEVVPGGEAAEGMVEPSGVAESESMEANPSMSSFDASVLLLWSRIL